MTLYEMMSAGMRQVAVAVMKLYAGSGCNSAREFLPTMMPLERWSSGMTRGLGERPQSRA